MNNQPKTVRVRMAPSPTGSPHVGLVRTALFNWAFARHHHGTFVFRIEDTDRERSTQESYDAIIDLMRWLGLDWDEGPEVGGPHAPYFQSERGDIYRDALARLAESSYTYDCFCTNEEVDARRKASGSKVMGYDGFCRDLSTEQRAAFEAEGRRPVVRFRMPDGSITWHDLVRGDVTFETRFVPDYALCRANGDPLYTLVNPVDDAYMEITHVLRGEDLLSSTPRQIALYAALEELGIAKATPEFGHLPYVMGEGNKKLSKRDPEAHALAYRDQGFLPEGLLNYLALLGWAIAADRDVFSMEEMVAAFDIADVNPNPARFDMKKAEAINAAHMRLLSLDVMTERVLPFLKGAGVLSDPVNPADTQLLELAMPLVAERINKLTESVDMLGFLFVDEESFTRDEADAEKLLNDDGRAVVRRALDALERVGEWSTGAIQDALQAELVEAMGVKPRNAFGPVRVAVTGRRVSPPLFESMELLGRDRSLARLRSALG
ncbi:MULTISPECIES: glutamate--tRNA ligase [unclassified Nocardioides]|uniref:Glutamate--tRNA ligase n=1 Tax=Nocardioides sp. (strain ATCC BAA-499 / JS614) TaxID=196162 RepID=SYE_NOCSJ|nr:MULTISPECIES: glutamate--tRNA ligase [unclassified Nocardioides]A1SM03.1 RecName: Full=Glutamate--tRNA ligase; AltName: Full=Glutamyl-tRNA synthetase; Short=GluRS [Nocardioides sp. JS614]ABL82838.1 glutamyl-tRNA synthetase [Nocardioides sp. JS614]